METWNTRGWILLLVIKLFSEYKVHVKLKDVLIKWNCERYVDGMLFLVLDVRTPASHSQNSVESNQIASLDIIQSLSLIYLS